MTTIAAAEFQQRRERARQAAARAGLAGLLVCSRGGGSADRYANVKYLADFYSRFPFIPDVAGEWSARGHAFVVLPVAGSPVLVADDRPPAGPAAIDEVALTDDVIATTAACLERCGLASGRLGVAGADTLPWSVHAELARRLPAVEWLPADALLNRLRMVKSPGEIAKLQRASRLGCRATEAMLEKARPGVSHGEVAAAGLEVLARHGGILYNAFMSSGRGGNDPRLVEASFPTWAAGELLEEGDWFHVGISGALDGYFFDHARSHPIGPATAEQVRVFEAPLLAVQAAIAAVRPGVTAGEVARVGREKLESLGFALEGGFKGFGHGIGLGWDSPWLVESDATPLEENMVLCVERSLRHMGYVGDFEETVAVTSDGCRLLTDARIRWW